jgi:hypothetical protein
MYCFPPTASSAPRHASMTSVRERASRASSGCAPGEPFSATTLACAVSTSACSPDDAPERYSVRLELTSMSPCVQTTTICFIISAPKMAASSRMLMTSGGVAGRWCGWWRWWRWWW